MLTFIFRLHTRRRVHLRCSSMQVKQDSPMPRKRLLRLAQAPAATTERSPLITRTSNAVTMSSVKWRELALLSRLQGRAFRLVQPSTFQLTLHISTSSLHLLTGPHAKESETLSTNSSPTEIVPQDTLESMTPTHSQRLHFYLETQGILPESWGE